MNRGQTYSPIPMASSNDVTEARTDSINVLSPSRDDREGAVGSGVRVGSGKPLNAESRRRRDAGRSAIRPNGRADLRVLGCYALKPRPAADARPIRAVPATIRGSSSARICEICGKNPAHRGSRPSLPRLSPHPVPLPRRGEGTARHAATTSRARAPTGSAANPFAS
jgi:hypothetical protein